MPNLAAIRDVFVTLASMFAIVIGFMCLYVVHPAFAVTALTIAVGGVIVYYTMKGQL